VLEGTAPESGRRASRTALRIIAAGPLALGAALAVSMVIVARSPWVADPAKTPTGIFLELHAQWFLGPLGEVIGALVALLVFISLLSGLVVYAPYVRRIAFGVLRRGRGPRLLQLDLHNFIGSVVLGWLLVVTITGFCLGFGTIAQGLWQNTETILSVPPTMQFRAPMLLHIPIF
jgi:uncharacterized iron-regulated membrane protein